uniref:Uncharacterized protein n=1 Tax=Steinernema glaseri TaxID=37863 RepID=A0A1I8ABN0_9BILA
MPFRTPVIISRRPSAGLLVNTTPYNRYLFIKFMEHTPSDDGAGGHLLHAADVLAAEESIVALFAPLGAPAVLDDPEGLLALDAIADDEHAVVQHGGRAEDLQRKSFSKPMVKKQTRHYHSRDSLCQSKQPFHFHSYLVFRATQVSFTQQPTSLIQMPIG